jgi:pimeloyl-ACP methyl ester carboxylesterase
MTTSYLERAEGRVAYELHGDGPLVLLLHGMGVDRSVYRFTVPALVEAGFRVAAMDLRGHGESDATFRSYDDEATASDALALVDYLGGPALLVGHSMAAGASVIAAAERPPAVAGTVLIGPFVRNPAVNPLLPLALRLMLARPWGPAMWRSYYRANYPSRRPADLDAHLRRVGAGLRWSAFLRTTRTSHAPAQQRLGSVTAPSLVVMGTKDRDWPDPVAEARFVASALRAESLLVDGAGHYPMAEFPEVVNPALVAFARKISTSG